MRRILLVLEDYQELSTLQGLLMKFGWDVQGVKRDVLVKEPLFSFRPEAIIAGAQGPQVNGVELARSIKSSGSGMRVFLVCGQTAELKGLSKEDISGFFLRPLDPRAVIKALAPLTGARQKMIVERYERIFGEAIDSAPIHVAGGGEKASEKSSVKSQETKRDYSAWVASVENVEDAPWGRAEIKEAVKKIEEQPVSESADKDLQDFVRKLFSRTK